MSACRLLVTGSLLSLSLSGCATDGAGDGVAKPAATEPCAAPCSPADGMGAGGVQSSPSETEASGAGSGEAPVAEATPTAGESAEAPEPTEPPSSPAATAGPTGARPVVPTGMDAGREAPDSNPESGAPLDPEAPAPEAPADAAPGTEPGASPVEAGPPSGRLRAVPVQSSGATLGYWEYLPPTYGSGPVPLLVFTHGAAWQGAGTLETLDALLEVGPPNLISNDLWPNERPFLVLSPQNPRAGCFEPDDIDAFYRHAFETYDIDPKRVYHTGQSCGAIGAWGYLADHLDEFVTAAVLIAGDGRESFERAGCDLGRTAIWALHNENDSAVSSQGSIVPLEGLLACTPVPDVRLTIYPGETAHDAWTKTYDLSAGHDIYAWLLEHEHP